MTELDPPKTLDMEKYFAGAKALTEAGSDVITLADNSLAILRVSNLAIGAMLKERFQHRAAAAPELPRPEFARAAKRADGHVRAGHPPCAAADGRPGEDRGTTRVRRRFTT